MSGDDKKLYLLKNLDKKSVYNREYWSRDEETFEIEEMFRWGETTLWLTSEEKDEIMELIENGEPVCAGEYEMDDQNLDDGCSLYFEECSEELCEHLETIFEEGFYSALEDDGWTCDDAETIYVGSLSLEQIEE